MIRQKPSLCFTYCDAEQERRRPLSASHPIFNQLLWACVSNHSSQEAKVAIFRSLFRGRVDVYPRRFESHKTGKSGYQSGSIQGLLLLGRTKGL
jgi:hypothetical protein